MAWEAIHRRVVSGAPIENFQALFLTILKRRCIDALRVRQRRPIPYSLTSYPGADEDDCSPEAQLPGFAPDPLDAILSEVALTTIYDAIDRLGVRDAAIVRGRLLDRLSNKDMARCVVSTGLVSADGDVEKRVENYFYRAVTKLREELRADVEFTA
jgi:DNA-directed RNA polymerase specialized sigma24 family protein